MNSENKSDSAISVIINDTNPESSAVKCNGTTPHTLPIDDKIAVLGKLCRNNHDYCSTGMSRRFVRDGRCAECRSASRQKWYGENTDFCHNLTNTWRNVHRDLSNISARKWRKSNPERCRKSKYKYESKSWVKTRFSAKKSQCKRLNIEFDLTPSFLDDLWNKQRGKCYWLNVPIELERQHVSPLSATLERLDPRKGYTQDNVVWASYFANTGRRDCPAEEFRAIVKTIKTLPA